ncbi:hypothetical protein D3C72_1147050 [compost metagenome]
MKEIMKVASGETFLVENFPSKSVIKLILVPEISMLAPGIGSPSFEEITVPFTTIS